MNTQLLQRGGGILQTIIQSSILQIGFHVFGSKVQNLLDHIKQ